ncbi:MAG TPA: helix-turn-helix domain-containing protein [Spirochaetia bacterium]|nr:helix-turn-helix domain-containing protein [Spirochaetia bacterium]
MDVAFQVGFNSKTTFNSFFAQDTGMTPKEFRRKFATSPGK